jgi:hypothetical protein
MPHGASRRRFLQATGAVVAAGAAAGTVPTGIAAASSGSSSAPGDASPAAEGPGWFLEPDTSVRPKFRWWWPGGKVENSEIAAEVEAMADAGFGGFEIADVWDSVSGTGDETIDPVKYGWGTASWNSAVATALRTAKKRGLTADLTIGPHWPSAIPGLTPDGKGSAKELAHGLTSMSAGTTFEGTVPQPASKPSGVTGGNPSPAVTPVLHTVLAARLQSGATTGDSVVKLVEDSVVDLTAKVTDGSLTWTAPTDGNWALIALWSRGTGQIVNMYDAKAAGSSPVTSPQSYVVDHFGAEGAQAVVDYWDDNLLTQEVRTLLRQVGGAIFEDSLELKTTAHWTPTLPAEFKKRRGYDLTRYLPLIIGSDDAVLSYGDDVTARVRHDYQQTLSDLFLDNRILPLKKWAASLGMELRNQAYGAPLDSALIAGRTGIPEGESLAFSDLDSFRLLAGGRDLGGRPVLSDEAGAFSQSAYAVTWEQLVTTVGRNYAAGVNQAVLHGFAYADAPGAGWPGFAAFSPLFGGAFSFAEAWGPRQPTWEYARDVSGYLSRLQAVLRTGTPRTDVAVYHQEFNASDGAPFFKDTGLQQAGYSYQFVSHGALTLERAYTRKGVLAPDGPAYRALVLNGQSTLPLETARTLLDHARNGLPIVVVGDAPAATPGYYKAASQDKEVTAVVDKLLAQRSVVRVAAESDVPAALRAADVLPSADPDTAGPLLSVRRTKGAATYYFLLNDGEETLTRRVSLLGTGAPHRYDPWTGSAEPVADATTAHGRTAVAVRLAPGDATVVALLPGTATGASVSGGELLSRKGTLALRATAAGTYTTKLATGRTVRTTISAVPAAQTLSSWTLKVEDWKPGATATETEKTVHTVALDALVPWTEIPGLEDVSGIGTYTTTVDLPKTWSAANGAFLDLGGNFDTARVIVNGHRLDPVDLLDPVVDLAGVLSPGSNTVTVEVATTLLNRLRVARPTLFGSKSRQQYGLLGPVTLTPYTTALVSSAR